MPVDYISQVPNGTHLTYMGLAEVQIRLAWM
jgi:hypothetical protein